METPEKEEGKKPHKEYVWEEREKLRSEDGQRREGFDNEIPKKFFSPTPFKSEKKSYEWEI